MSDLTLEDNPISVDKKLYYQAIFEECEGLQTLDYQNIKKIKEENGFSKETITKTQKELSDLEKKIFDDFREQKNDKGLSEDSRENEIKQSETSNLEKKIPTPHKNPKTTNSLLNKHFESSPNKKQNNNFEEDITVSQKNKESEDGLDPETVIKIIEDQFNKEILRVEVLFETYINLETKKEWNN